MGAALAFPPGNVNTVARHPALAGAAVFLAVVLAAGFLPGPISCADGWLSPSIGRQGACSSHGGVDRSRDRVAFVGAMGAGGLTYWLAARHRRHGRTEPRLSPSDGPLCPRCGRSMVERTARRGRHAGSRFFGCSGYPACRGTRTMRRTHTDQATTAS
jgi:hypothetical protein